MFSEFPFASDKGITSQQRCEGLKAHLQTIYYFAVECHVHCIKGKRKELGVNSMSSTATHGVLGLIGTHCPHPHS